MLCRHICMVHSLFTIKRVERYSDCVFHPCCKKEVLCLPMGDPTVLGVTF